MSTDLISVRLNDGSGAGGVKAVPIYFPSGLSVANILAGAQAFATDIDAATDALVDELTVTMNLALPSGLKDTRGSNTVHEGALLSYIAAGTIYRHGIFVPSWSNDGFESNAVLSSGVYSTLINAFINGLGTGGSEVKPTDKYGNDLTNWNGGKRRFRK